MSRILPSPSSVGKGRVKEARQVAACVWLGSSSSASVANAT